MTKQQERTGQGFILFKHSTGSISARTDASTEIRKPKTAVVVATTEWKFWSAKLRAVLGIHATGIPVTKTITYWTNLDKHYVREVTSVTGP